MNGILPKYLTQHSLWSMHESVTNAYALELYAFLQGNAPARSQGEKPALPEASFLQASSRSSETLTQSRVMIIPVHGAIIPFTDYKEGFAGLDLYKRYLQESEDDPSSAGSVLHLRSGGGSCMQLKEFTAFTASLKKPVVAYTDEYMASAAYAMALPCKYIMASPYSAMIANIGTVFTTLDMIPALEKQGAKFIKIYGTEATDKDLGMKEAMEGKPEKLKAQLITPFQDMFLDDVAKYRPAVSQDARSGAIYTTEKALDLGLIDGVGTLADAAQKVLELALSSNTYTQTQSSTRMELTKTAVLGWFGIATKATKDEELTVEDVTALKVKADAHAGLETKVGDLTTANTNLSTELSTLKTTNATLQAKVTELEAKLTTVPGAAPTAPVQANTDKVETDAALVEGKMEGEDEFLEKYGF